MGVDAVVRERLLKKLHITARALNYRIKALQGDQAITREDALLVIAFEEGVPIADRVEAEDLARINDYVAKRKASRIGDAGPAVPSRKGAPSAAPPRMVAIGGSDFQGLPGMSTRQVNEAKRMANEVYPILYVFENSAREIIARVLKSAYGDKWWDKVASASEKNSVAARKAKEGAEAWHSQRNAHPIYYTDLAELAKIVNRQWKHFKVIFPRANWFDGLVDDMAVSRNEVAHMNPIKKDDVKHLESAYAKWVKQITAKAGSIPS